MSNYTISMVCRNITKNEIKWTNTLCGITLLWIFYFFLLKCPISRDWCHMPFCTLLSRELIKLCWITKTSLANFDIYVFKQLTGTIPGNVSHRSSQLFQALRYRQLLHIAFVRDDGKDWGTLAISEPQTLWLTIKHSLNFSQCYKYL